ncbi:hypothetical protein C0991_004812 [Blastosporella zonata]|nr:hypothetical protein C0991_004812 [Blastosporella zonata]
MLVLSILLVALTAVCSVAQFLPTENFDPKCADNTQPGFEMDIFQLNVPLQTFVNATGTFFGSYEAIAALQVDCRVPCSPTMANNIIDQTGPLISTTGEDDTVGATRTGNFSGAVFRERLIDISQTPDRLMHRFTLDNGPITFVNVLYESYTEEMVVQSICGGTATWVSFTDKYCADNAARGYSLYRRARRVLVDVLVDSMGALYFEGSCPN